MIEVVFGIVVAMMVVAACFGFLAVANRHQQREPPRSQFDLFRTELYTEKGNRYRRRSIAVSVAALVLWFAALLAGILLSLVTEPPKAPHPGALRPAPGWRRGPSPAAVERQPSPHCPIHCPHCGRGWT